MTSTHAPCLVSTQDATFAYGGRPVLVDATFGLASGDRVGVLGPNGAGKSTLLRGLLGFLPPIRGTVLIGNRDAHRLPRAEVARQIAYLPQDVRLAPGLLAVEVVLLGRAARRATGAAAWNFDAPADVDAAHLVLQEVGVRHLALRPFRELSGGERRLVLLALALAQAESAIVLDEPTASLDLRASVTIAERLHKATLDRNLALLLVTHDVSLAARLCNRIVLVGPDPSGTQGGAGAGQGTPSRILADDVPAAVLRPEILGPAFGLPLGVFTPEGTSVPVIFPAGGRW